MNRLVLTGMALLPNLGLTPSTIAIVDGTIDQVTAGLAPAADLTAPAGGCITPGFIDLQVNGAFGIDLSTDPAGVDRLSHGLLASGVTAFLPTLITAPLPSYRPALQTLQQAQAAVRGARLLGVHVEGPYLNPVRHGAHDPAYLRSPDLAEIATWLDPQIVRIVTLAPELPGALPVIDALRRQGIVVSAGHSDCTLSQAEAGFAAGVAWGTHLFNAMAPLHHREPGLAGALLSSTVPCGLIADGQHVHPAVVKLAWRAKGPQGLTLVTDAMAATGMPPGRYRLADAEVLVDDTTARLADGTLAGSILTMDQALRNVQRFTGCSLADALVMASTTPAAVLGLAQMGRIAAGCVADLVFLDHAGHVTRTLLAGKSVYQAPGSAGGK